jgi:signal transduction histidine kinase
MLCLSGLGVASLVSMLIGSRGAGNLAFYLPSAMIVTAASLLLLFLLFAGMRRFGVPLGNIVEGANRLANGEFSARVAEWGPPSLRTVAHAFNNMAERLESQERQRRHFMAEVAHELRTPLAVVQGRLEGLLDGIYSRDDAHLSEILEETHVLSRLVEDLRTLANTESGTLTLNKEPTDIAILLHDVVNSFSKEAEHRKVSIRVEMPPDIPLIDVDPVRIREVFANLISNALNHTCTGGTIRVNSEVSNQRLLVSVADSGSGIAPEALPKIFDRFYKGAGSRGSGLGLTIARNLVALHNGEIRAESLEGHGTTLRVELPVSATSE